VPTWADGAGKRATMVVEGRDVLIPPTLARCLGGALTHMVRNCISHGLELPELREHSRTSRGYPRDRVRWYG
jgi:chemotaxis protein histidine kinase CheA